MANTSIQLKKSGATGNVPVSLAYGELALNYADGKLFYKHANGSIASIATGSVTNSFATINANSSLILASTPTDTLSIVPGNNITISTDAINKTITINSTTSSGGGGGTTYNQSLNTTDPVVFSSVGFANNNSKVLGSNTSLSTTPNQIVDSFDISQYRTMKYVIQAVDESSVHSTEVLLVHDDNDAYITEYATIQSSSNLISISANVASSNVNLIITPTNANTIIDFFRVSLQSARPIGFSVYGDLMAQTGTLDLMIGSGSWDENT